MNIATLSGRRVVVTGAGGFIGARLVELLRAGGCEVTALSRANGFTLLDDELPLAGMDHVFHLAAETGVPRSWEDPVAFHLTNAHGTMKVLEQCRAASCGITYVGAYIYGTPVELPISERHPLDPNNPYAFSKWMGEQACAWYAQVYELPVTAIRLFNVFGPGQSNSFIIPRIVEQATDPSIGEITLMDLKPRRDYLYVDDAVDAFIMSVRTSGFRIYNVGSGVSYSVQEVVDTVQTVAGSNKPVISVGTERRNEIPDVRADCSLISSETGWTPRYSFQEGIAAMIDGATR
jgi:nucleoside-diphosphate-sugar epimerase